jgi:hypothetical protein
VVVVEMVTAIEQDPPLPSLAFSITTTDPLPVAEAPTLIETVAVHEPASGIPPPPATMLAPATPDFAPSEGKAPLLEVKLTVTDRDSP